MGDFLNLVLAGLRLGLNNRQVGEKWVSDDCSYLCKGLKQKMKKNILFLLFLVFSSVAPSNFKFPNEAQQGTIFLNIERYKDSGLKSFVTTCKTRLECYKKIQWGIKTGRFVYCKKVTMVINNHIVWGIDFEKNKIFFFIIRLWLNCLCCEW
jgi:hypothetical protein